MSQYLITLSTGDSEIQRVSNGEEDLLETMREAGLAVRKSCRNGVCGLCKCHLQAGEITYHWRKPHGLWEKHIDAGMILPCIAYPLTDLELDQIPLLDES